MQRVLILHVLHNLDKEEAIALSPSPIYYIAKENLFLSLEHV